MTRLTTPASIDEAPEASRPLLAEGDTVVSPGRFKGAHRVTGKTADAAYAHVWDVVGGKILRFRQYIDTRAVA